MILRVLLLTFFAAVIARCQGTQTTFMNLLSNATATGATSPVRNIGQAAHLAQVIFTNAPAQTCAAGAVDLGWELSFDGVTFTRVGDQITAIALNTDGQLATNIQAYAAAPYIRIKVRAFDTVKCLLTINYSGTVAGQANITLTAGSVSVNNTPSVTVTNTPSVTVANTPSVTLTGNGNVRSITRAAYVNDYDSGISAVPNASTSLTATTTLVTSIFCSNNTAVDRTLNITDTAGNNYTSPGFVLAAHSNGSIFNLQRGMVMTGIKWAAGAAAAITCQVVGMQ